MFEDDAARRNIDTDGGKVRQAQNDTYGVRRDEIEIRVKRGSNAQARLESRKNHNSEVTNTFAYSTICIIKKLSVCGAEKYFCKILKKFKKHIDKMQGLWYNTNVIQRQQVYGKGYMLSCRGNDLNLIQ